MDLKNNKIDKKINYGFLNKDIEYCRDIMLNRRINEGAYTLIKENYNTFIKLDKDDKNIFINDLNNYDFVFCLYTSSLLKKPIQREISGKLEDKLLILAYDYSDLVFPERFIFTKEGFTNLDFLSDEDFYDRLKEYKFKVNIKSLNKIINLTNNHFSITKIINEDSIQRYCNLFDLLLINNTYINRKDLEDFINLDFKVKLDILTVLKDKYAK